MSDQPVRVVIVGDHPWKGHAGTLVAVQKPSIGILPVMGRVVLDEPSGHECFAESKNLRKLDFETYIPPSHYLVTNADGERLVRKPSSTDAKT